MSKTNGTEVRNVFNTLKYLLFINAVEPKKKSFLPVTEIQVVHICQCCHQEERTVCPVHPAETTKAQNMNMCIHVQ